MANEELFDFRQNLNLNVKNLKSEEDVKQKIIVPFLKSKGYDLDCMRFEHTIKVQVGHKIVNVRSDIEFLYNDKAIFVVDAKRPDHTLSNKDILQVSSYGKLVNTPAAIYSFVTNGTDVKGINNLDGSACDNIPSKSELIAKLQKDTPKHLTDIELHEAKATLITIMSMHDFYNVIKSCKKIIENEALIRSDQSFKEMTKIMLVKMNEENRARNENKQNRFNSDYIAKKAEVNHTNELAVFKELFSDAISKYNNIYRKDDPGLLISNSHSLMSVIKLLEPYSLLGTNEDIKGNVYEIFLKANLRGDLDQYFTPREIVRFIVNLANPKYHEKFVDPAAGSGGFLVSAFLYVNEHLKDSSPTVEEYEKAIKILTDKYIWGQEADYDLTVLTKINMIMHGDGWNHIIQGDTLKTQDLPDNYFDLVLENPPFTIKYNNPEVLDKYELGQGRKDQELDLLFIERSIKLLKPGGRLIIIIPEGMLNLSRYNDFRKWMLKKAWLISSISLPAGTFQPFGGSATKAAVLELRKKGKEIEGPDFIFAASVEKIGYETGKKDYKKISENDLPWVIKQNKSFNTKLVSTKREKNNSLAIWRPYSDVNCLRLDAGTFLSDFNVKNINDTISLDKIFEIDSPQTKLLPEQEYNYVQVPYFSETNGALLKIDRVKGNKIKSQKLNKIDSGCIYFTRINPKQRRIGIVPNLSEPIFVSSEVYRLKWKRNSYLRKECQYAIIPFLRSNIMTQKISLLSTGSSSSRARLDINSLKKLRIPIDVIQKINKDEMKSQFLNKKANDLFVALSDYNKLFD